MWPIDTWKRIPDLLQQHENTRKLGYKVNNVGCLEFYIQAVIAKT